MWGWVVKRNLRSAISVAVLWFHRKAIWGNRGARAPQTYLAQCGKGGWGSSSRRRRNAGPRSQQQDPRPRPAPRYTQPAAPPRARQQRDRTRRADSRCANAARRYLVDGARPAPSDRRDPTHCPRRGRYLRERSTIPATRSAAARRLQALIQGRRCHRSGGDHLPPRRLALQYVVPDAAAHPRQHNPQAQGKSSGDIHQGDGVLWVELPDLRAFLGSGQRQCHQAQ